MSVWETVHYHSTGYSHLKDMGIERYKNNTITVIRHPGDYICRGCGAQFGSEEEINAHCEQDINCAFAGWVGSPEWDEYDPAWDEILSSLAKAVKKLK